MPPTEEEIKRFCMYCDDRNNNGPGKCEAKHKLMFVGRDQCYWSSIDGVRVFPVSKKYIVIGGKEYLREEEDKIMTVVQQIKSEASRRRPNG